MAITKQQILNRKDELMKAKFQLQANLQATDGAIQDCDYWLAQLVDEPAPSEGTS